MDTINSNIPLGVKPPEFMNPAQLMNLHEMALRGQMQRFQLQEQMQAADRQRQAQGVFQDSRNFDEKMRLNEEGIQKLYGIDPSLAQNVQKQQLAQDEQRALMIKNLAQADKATLENGLRRVEYAHDIGAAAVSAYENAIKEGGPGHAQSVAAKVLSDGIEEGRRSAVLDPETASKLAGKTFDYRQFKSQLPKAKDMVEMMKEAQKEGAKAPTTRKIVKGDQEIDQQWNVQTKQWEEVGKGPRSKMGITIGGGFAGGNGELMAALAERGVSLPAGFRSKEQQIAMLDGLRKRNPSLTADEIADKIKSGQIDLNAERASGRAAGAISGKVAYAENEIQEIAPLVRAASLKVSREKFVPWNKLKQYTGTQLSDPDLKELHSYLQTMSNAYDMLAARGGTDKDKRAENHRLLDSAESPEALERAISAMEKEAKAAGRAAEKSIKSSGRGDSAGAGKAAKVDDSFVAGLLK